MSIPSGVVTATVLFGKDSDFLGENAAVSLRIVPSHNLVWAATGERLTAFEAYVEAEAGAVGSFLIPVVDQDGFLNVRGDAIKDWHYTVHATVRRGNGAVGYRKVFSPVTAQSTVDLDLIPEDGQVAAPGLGTVPPVTSVNGETGAVTVEGATDAAVAEQVTSGPETTAALSATIDTFASTITPGIPARLDAFGRIITDAVKVVPESSNPTTVYMLGDSTYQGNQDGTGITIATELAKMLDGVTVVNGGVSGRTSTELAVRFGAIAPMLTFTGGQVPASGSATVTVTPTATWRSGVVETYSFAGQITVGATTVAGALELNETTGVFTFVRGSAGSAIPLTGPVPFSMTVADAYRDAVLVSAFGINNYNAADFMDAVRDTDAVRRSLSPQRPRHLVCDILTSDSQTAGTTGHTKITAANEALKAAYAPDIFGRRRWYIDKGLIAAGITPVAGDTTDQQGDTVPRSLRHDNVHPKGVAYKAEARALGNALADRGWVRQIDPLNIPGALVIIEPGAAWNPWAAGIPADGATLPNLARHRLLDIGFETGIDATWRMDAAANNGTNGIMERSTKVGSPGTELEFAL